jgi:hypothetical protein
MGFCGSIWNLRAWKWIALDKHTAVIGDIIDVTYR